MFSPVIVKRESFGHLLNTMGLTGDAVEIGTHLGHFASSLLDQWPGHLTCIDPYITNLEDYHDVLDGMDREEHFREASNRLSPFRRRVRFLRYLSSEVVDLFKNNSLNFVYVDANHAQKYVIQDCLMYWPKVKKGGVFAGHDISGRWTDQIKPVVDLISSVTGLDYYIVPGDGASDLNPLGDCASWYFIK